MTGWDSSDPATQKWTGDQFEYRRLTWLTAKAIAERESQIMYTYVEDETERGSLLDDASPLSAINRFGAAGWVVSPMGSGDGRVPPYIMRAIWDSDRNVHQEDAHWVQFWMSRRRLTS